MEALERSFVSGLEANSVRERTDVIRFQRVFARMFPGSLVLESGCVGGRTVDRQSTRDYARRAAFPITGDAKLARQLVPLVSEIVLVPECRLETELVIGAASEPVAEAGEIARCIQVTIQDAVRLGLNPRGVHRLKGERITRARRVIQTAGESVHQRSLGASSPFIEKSHRILIQVLAEDRVPAQPVIAHETVAAVE